MAIFTREDRREGDAALVALVTAPDAVPGNIQGYRLIDSDLTSLSGMLSTSYEQNMVALSAGKQRQASKRLQGKQVIFTFSSGDASGVEQQIIKQFFTYNRPISYIDTERDIDSVLLYVTSIDDSYYSSSDSIQITATMVDSDMMSKNVTEITKKDVAAGETSTLTANYKNAAPTDCQIRVELGASKLVSWEGTTFTLTAKTEGSLAGSGTITAVVGKVTSSGIRFSSLDEFEYGYGTITNLQTTKFFSIPAGGTTALTLTVKAPADSAVSAKLIAVAQAPKGELAF